MNRKQRNNWRQLIFAGKKLKASSILEPVIASVVLTIGVSTFSMSLGNAIKMGNASNKINIRSVLHEIALKSTAENNMLNETFTYENFTVQKNVTKYNEKENLYLLNIKALDTENELIEEYKQVITISIQ
jgi:hypothetical protein